MDPKLLFLLLASFASSSVVINTLLIFIVLRYSNPSIGPYKWFLVAFAIFETLYAVVVFASLPVHLITDNSWIVFSHGSLLENTPLHFWGPGLYCTFYELWIGFIVVLFLYHYVVVCWDSIRKRISESFCLKFGLFFLYSIHFCYSVVCGMYWCTRNEPSWKMKNAVKQQFGFDDFDKMGYMLMGFKQGDGSFSPSGTLSVMNHYVLVASSALIIVFCFLRIWRNLFGQFKQLASPEDFHLRKQFFVVLVFETIIPLIGCHLPTLIFLTYPFWPKGSHFGSNVSILSVLTTIPKVLDPLVTIFCIKDYRDAFFNIITGNCKKPIKDEEETDLEINQ